MRYVKPHVFWSKLNGEALSAALQRRCVIDANGCWLWQGSTNSSGYGVVYYKNRIRYAHRLMLETSSNESLRATIQVCHRCDVRSCCNPAHLFAGTAKDNAVDCVSKGRAHKARGENAGGTKLTTEQVLTIRQLYAMGGKSCRTIGLYYNVGAEAIRRIVVRATWKHV